MNIINVSQLTMLNSQFSTRFFLSLSLPLSLFSSIPPTNSFCHTHFNSHFLLHSLTISWFPTVIHLSFVSSSLILFHFLCIVFHFTSPSESTFQFSFFLTFWFLFWHYFCSQFICHSSVFSHSSFYFFSSTLLFWLFPSFHLFILKP